MDPLPVPHPALVLAVYVLAVARITRLVNADRITDPIRLVVARRQRAHIDAARAIDRLGVPTNTWDTLLRARHMRASRRWATLSYYLGCPWCVSIWAAGATAWAPLWAAHVAAVQYVALVLAASMVVGIAAELLPGETVEVVDDDK